MQTAENNTHTSDSREILGLAVPAILTQVSLTVVEVVDTIFIGKLGPIPLAASGLIMLIVWNVRMMAEGFGVGLTACIARMVGARDLRNAALYFRTAIIGFALLGILLVPVLRFTHNGLFRAMQMPEELFSASRDYFSLFVLFIPFVYLVVAQQYGFRAAGDTLTPMLVGVGMNVVNLILDWVLIFGKFGLPAMGIRGAAFASGISFVCGAGTLMLLASKKSWGPFRKGPVFSLSHLIKVLRFGLPATVERMTMSISQIIVMALAVNPLGSYSVAGFQIVIRLASLSFMPGFGFSIAASTIAGQNLGAAKPKRGERLIWKSVLYATCIFAAVAILYFVLPDSLIRMFTDSKEIISIARRPLRLYAIMAVFLAPTMVMGGGLRGAGDTRFPMIVMFLSRFFIRLPVCWALSIQAGLGLFGVWIGMCLDFFIRSVVLTLKFRQGKWKFIKV